MNPQLRTANAEASTLIKLLAAGGVLAPVAFMVSALAQSLTRDDHRLLRDPISALAAGPTGWIQDVTFACAGVLLIGFSLALHRAIRPGRRIYPGPQLLALFGLGLVAAAVWPAVDASGAFTEGNVPHVIAGFVTFGSAGLAALALAPRLARDPRWTDLSRYVRSLGVILVILFVAIGALVRPPGGPLHDWLGLAQWIFLAVWFPCIAVLAVRLLRMSRVRERQTQAGRAIASA